MKFRLYCPTLRLDGSQDFSDDWIDFHDHMSPGDDARKRDDLRTEIADLLVERSQSVIADVTAIFSLSGAESLPADFCRRVGTLVAELLRFAVREGRLDVRGAIVAELHRAAAERSLPIDRVFNFVYLAERAVLDDLALSERVGATSEVWPLVAQLIRRASFDVLAAYADRACAEAVPSLTDPLTTLQTRGVFDLVLAKELERAGRLGYPLSLLLIEIDDLVGINRTFGPGVGGKILERFGILARGFFRQHDWVARYAEAAVAILLTGGDARHAGDLVDSLRQTVAERLVLRDQRTDHPMPVTVSATVINMNVTAGDLIDPDRLLSDAEAALSEAKRGGPNRVKVVEDYAGGVRRGTPPNR